MLALYTLALLGPPVRVRLLFLFCRDTALTPPRSDRGRRRIFAVFASVLTCPADGADTIVDTFNLGAPAASAGNAGAHPAWGLRGRRPSSSALQASRRYGRGVGGPKTGWKFRVLQQSRQAERVRALGWRTCSWRPAGCWSDGAGPREQSSWRAVALALASARRKSDDRTKSQLRGFVRR